MPFVVVFVVLIDYCESIIATMKDYAVAFGEPNSHGCIFNAPQVGGFFRVVLRIWGSFAGYKRSEKSPKNTKMRGMEDISIWQNSSLL